MLRALSLWTVLAALLLVVAPARAADESADAREVLQLAGLRAGLCVHLGCGRDGSAGLTAALAESGTISVHGIALDEASLTRARKAIEDRGVIGKALAECIAVNPLPYLADLVNVVVVEDMPALAAKGLTKDEILRVIAPNGSLCVKEAGKWAKTVKPRPKDMDDWTHPFHGADYNMVSNDKALKFPIGFRWIDGIPVNINMWAACRGWVVAGGRCYTLSSNELDNVLPGKGKTHYLSARDAFNGLPLWKVKLETTDDGAHLTWRNAGPVVADDERAYAVQDNKLIIVDGPTGKILATCNTKYKPHRVALLDGVLLAACWEERESTNDGVEGGSLWATWIPKSTNGTVEAYDCKTGQQKWSASMPAYTLAAADKVVYVLTHVGAPMNDKDMENEFNSLLERELKAELAKQAEKEAKKEDTKDAAKELAGDTKKAEPVQEKPKDPMLALAQDMAKKIAPDYAKETGKDATKEEPWKGSWKKLTKSQKDPLPSALRQRWDRQVVALDLQTGKEKWRTPFSKLGSKVDMELGCAGPGYVIVYKRDERGVTALSAADGSVLWQQKGSNTWTPVVDGMLWANGKKFDPLTGAVKANIPINPGDQGCTPSVVVNNIITRTRGCGYEQLIEEPNKPATKKDLRYTGARGGCMLGMVPANGMFYTAQNNCRCSPGQIYGFLAVGPCGQWPTEADYKAPHPIEKGPAFGKVEELPVSADDWPSFRANAERSAGTATKGPSALKEIWKTQAAVPASGPLAETWRARLASCVTAPVSAAGLVFVGGSDTAQVIALDGATGKKAWTTTIGGRIDTPPTIVRGVALVGSHDGWVYALSAKDGQFVYRTRVAPWERKLMAYGQVESVWPAVGTVLVQDGVAYANAGRTSESDGGIAVLAFDPLTGAQAWGNTIAVGPQRQNDMLVLKDGALAWFHKRLDPKTGSIRPDAVIPGDHSQGGMMDGTWTLVGKRRSGNAFAIGTPASDKNKSQTALDLMAWNDSLVVAPNFAMPREKADKVEGKVSNKDFAWQPQVSGQVEAMAVCGDKVFFACRDKGDHSGSLTMVSAKDGKMLAEVKLPVAPTYDGLCVARGKVYVTLQNGFVYCFGE
ncbi:MAG TPA: PQQ-binding-like beta-propeller repeat protein [Planctomycetota bacterium]|jgi:outer membrane protein assembly factor BamB